MDKAYLQHIRRQDDLRATLVSYGVKYYVAFAFERNFSHQFKDGCFIALEPSIAGPDTMRMRSTFCQQPLLEFPGFDGKYMIFAVRGDVSQSPS